MPIKYKVECASYVVEKNLEKVKLVKLIYNSILFIEGSLIIKRGAKESYHAEDNEILSNFYIKENLPTWGMARVKEHTIGQYTGMQDEKGTKIF